MMMQQTNARDEAAMQQYQGLECCVALKAIHLVAPGWSPSIGGRAAMPL
jgi:hypothetical protein